MKILFTYLYLYLYYTNILSRFALINQPMYVTDSEKVTDTENEDEKLKFISSVSNDLRSDILKLLEKDVDQIWKVLNFLILLTGVYVTLSIFLWNKLSEKLPILWPEILSGIFLIIAFILAIIEIFPTPSAPIIFPREVYKMFFDQHEKSIEKLIVTRLISSNDVLVYIEKKTFKRQQIILFTLISLINFLLFGIYCAFNNYEIYVNILAIVFSVDFMAFYFYFINRGRTKIKEKENELAKRKDNKK